MKKLILLSVIALLYLASVSAQDFLDNPIRKRSIKGNIVATNHLIDEYGREKLIYVIDHSPLKVDSFVRFSYSKSGLSVMKSNVTIMLTLKDGEIIWQSVASPIKWSQPPVWANLFLLSLISGFLLVRFWRTKKIKRVALEMSSYNDKDVNVSEKPICSINFAYLLMALVSGITLFLSAYMSNILLAIFISLCLIVTLLCYSYILGFFEDMERRDSRLYVSAIASMGFIGLGVGWFLNLYIFHDFWLPAIVNLISLLVGVIIGHVRYKKLEVIHLGILSSIYKHS